MVVRRRSSTARMTGAWKTLPAKPKPTSPTFSGRFGPSILRKAVVRIAIQPPLPRFRGGDHRMSAGTCMLGRMTVGGAVAAQRGAALLASAQVDPLGADFHTVSALPALGVPHGCDCSEMGAGSVGHCRPLVFVRRDAPSVLLLGPGRTGLPGNVECPPAAM